MKRAPVNYCYQRVYAVLKKILLYRTVNTPVRLVNHGTECLQSRYTCYFLSLSEM